MRDFTTTVARFLTVWDDDLNTDAAFRFMFGFAIGAMLRRAYRLGRKDARRARKVSAARRYKSRLEKSQLVQEN